jgi:hypothetical protein
MKQNTISILGIIREEVIAETFSFLFTEAVRPRVTPLNVKKLYNKYVKVESSNIHSMLYNPKIKEMRVRFLSGAEYRYFNVPERIYIGLLNAPSHGKQFWKTARTTFRYERLDDFVE